MHLSPVVRSLMSRWMRQDDPSSISDYSRCNALTFPSVYWFLELVESLLPAPRLRHSDEPTQIKVFPLSDCGNKSIDYRNNRPGLHLHVTRLRHTGWWTIRQIQMDAASMEKNKRDLLSQHFCFFFLETKIEMVLGINLRKSILQLNINESTFWWELFYWCDASRPLSDWIMPITSCQIRLTGPRRKPARGVVINLEHQICSGELQVRAPQRGGSQ